MPRDREEEELTLARRHLLVEQAVSAGSLHSCHPQAKKEQPVLEGAVCILNSMHKNPNRQAFKMELIPSTAPMSLGMTRQRVSSSAAESRKHRERQMLPFLG